MKVFYTKHFPPGSFHGINLCGFLFVQKRWGKLNRTELHHEFIHTLQQIEMLFILFYIWYGIEYVVRIVQYKGDLMKAYRNISFEREAYGNERNSKYKLQRTPFSWVKYLRFDKEKQKK